MGSPVAQVNNGCVLNPRALWLDSRNTINLNWITDRRLSLIVMDHVADLNIGCVLNPHALWLDSHNTINLNWITDRRLLLIVMDHVAYLNIGCVLNPHALWLDSHNTINLNWIGVSSIVINRHGSCCSIKCRVCTQSSCTVVGFPSHNLNWIMDRRLSLIVMDHGQRIANHRWSLLETI